MRSQGSTTSTAGTRFYKNVMIPMADGVRLAMDLHGPPGDGPFPVILEYIPYRKDDQPPFTGKHDYYARHGYIGARIDCRGTGASEGTNDDEYRPIELRDGYDAIEWIAAQDWCTGKVAMTGVSYGGFTSVQIAALRPPHLATILPVGYVDDRYTDDCHFHGGAWAGYSDPGSYGAMMVGLNAMPPYPEYNGENWAQLWEQRLEENEPYILKWLQNQADGPYWRPGSVRGRYDDIQCPAYMVGGFMDGYCNAPLKMAAEMKTPHKVLMGPWNHAGPECETPGPPVDFMSETVRWCDHWLKGVDNGVMDEHKITVYVQSYDPPVTDRTQTTGYWRAEESFPVPGSVSRKLFLGADGCLSGSPESTQGSDEYDYRPSVGITGGMWTAAAITGYPTDQRPDEIYSVNYTTGPLDEPLEIIGAPRVTLHVSSTAPVMTFVARLSDVAPDGVSASVCRGWLNATRRDSLVDPEPLTPGQVYELTFDLDMTAWRFEEGHRIRLSVCSADFPNIWPTPHNGVNNVYRGGERPSALTLPGVPVRSAPDGQMPDDDVSLPAPDSIRGIYAPPPDEIPWEVAHDMLRDRTGFRIRQRRPASGGGDTQIATESALDFWVSNRDPSDASVNGRHSWRIIRRDGTIEIDSSTQATSTVESFHITIDLAIKVNGMPHHQKRWVRTIPRLLL